MEKHRCSWVKHPLDVPYHDEEWGVVCRDDRTLFEFLLLEGAQAGLAWITILQKRDNYRQAFANFDPERIARFDQKTLDELLQNPGIVRNKLKVNSAVSNARAYLDVVEEYGNFHEYIWQFVDGKPIQNQWQNASQVPVSTPESDAMSKDLKKRGFKFVGTTICYAYMQAMGMVNDHTIDCFRHQECNL